MTRPTTDAPSIRPLFLLSLPRTGSTLVQRVLAAHPKVATASEPWLLLPLIYARREKGVRAEYAHLAAAPAIQDFAEARQGGSAAFDDRLRAFVEGVYEDAAGEGAAYFLDKTPHYHFIADDLFRLFPDAKFVFLWRNPLGVLASCLDTIRENRFEPYLFRSEFTRGQASLVKAFEDNRARAHATRFEDLLGPDAERYWRAVIEYLELEWDPSILTGFTDVELQGRFGDPTGIKLYNKLSSEPLEKWRASFRGPVRQRWMIGLLDRIAPALETMGYDRDELVRDLNAAGPAPPAAVARDALTLVGSAVHRLTIRSALRVRDVPLPLGERYGTDAALRRRLLDLARSLIQ